MEEKCLEKYLWYLDALRESGVTNMLLAGPYLQKEFGLSYKEAMKVLAHWMKTYGDRHSR